MSTLREKERRKEQQDKFQAILSALLKDEDNKYCVDCDAKGPRWASWNLGLFLCIRCAGIHRNLGVHISRVKSVNLDTWTPEQVAMIQEIGNSRARAAYEANLPDGYRRPQTDSALESFIRAKYEHKKYMAREWVPPQPKVPKEFVTDSWLEDKADKKKPKPKQPSAVKLSTIPKSSTPVETSKPQQPAQKTEVTVPNPTEAKVNSLADDLLGLDFTPPQTNVQQPPSAPAQSGSNDLLEFFGAQKNPPSSVAAPVSQASNQTNSAVNGSASESNLFGEDADAGEKKTSTKDSIMALFAGSSSQPQMYGVPGADGQFYNVPYYEASNSLVPSPYCGFAKFDVHQTHGHANTLPIPGYGMQSMSGSPPGHFKPGMDFSSLTNQLSAFKETAPTYVCKVNQIYACNQMDRVEEGMSKQEAKTKDGQTVTLVVPNTNNNTPSKPSSSVPAARPLRINEGFYCYQGGMYIPQNQQGFTGAMPQQGMMGQPQQGMMGQSQGMMGQPQQGMMGQPQQSMMGQQNQGMMGQPQQGMMGQPQQGMMGQTQQGMMGQPQQGMMGQPQQGMMGQQQGMMGAQQGMMGMMGQQQQQQPGGMMGNTMMNGAQQAGVFQGQGQMMMGNANMYAPQQMQQLQFQQMQQPMGKTGNNWGNPSGQTLSNNLWQ